MKKISKKIIFSLFFGSFLFLMFGMAQAVNVALPTSTKQNATIDKRCNLVTSRINLIIVRYDNNKQRHIEKYQRIKERLKGINQTLKSRGCDTSQAEVDYQKLDAMIRDFAQQYDKFISLLRKTQEYICGQSQGNFVSALNEARQQLLVVRQKSLDIRNFYQSTIRADLLQLKTQCKNVPTPTSTQ